MRSFREPDRRHGDDLVYFDYARSLEAQKAPLPWRMLVTASLATAVACFSYGFGEGGALYGAILAAVGLFAPFAFIPLLRAQSALGGGQLTSRTRRPPP